MSCDHEETRILMTRNVQSDNRVLIAHCEVKNDYCPNCGMKFLEEGSAMVTKEPKNGFIRKGIAVDALMEIKTWAEAYPEDVFIEPKPGDGRRANEILKEHGMCIDAFTGSMGRHVLKGVKGIVEKALKEMGEE